MKECFSIALRILGVYMLCCSLKCIVCFVFGIVPMFKGIPSNSSIWLGLVIPLGYFILSLVIIVFSSAIVGVFTQGEEPQKDKMAYFIGGLLLLGAIQGNYYDVSLGLYMLWQSGNQLYFEAFTPLIGYSASMLICMLLFWLAFKQPNRELPEAQE